MLPASLVLLAPMVPMWATRASQVRRVERVLRVSKVLAASWAPQAERGQRVRQGATCISSSRRPAIQGSQVKSGGILTTYKSRGSSNGNLPDAPQRGPG